MSDDNKILVELGMAADQFESALAKARETFGTSVTGMGQDAREAGADIDRAFSALGIKSVEAMRYEIATLRQAFDTLKTSGRASAEDIARAETQLQAKVAALNAEINKGQQVAYNAGRALQEAFGVVGVRSATQIEKEIHDIDIALLKLGQDTRVSGEEFDRAWAGGQAKIAALKTELHGGATAADATSKSISGIGAVASTVGPLIAAAFGAQQFIDANIQSESLRRSMLQLTGSQQAAGAEMDWVRATANRLGQELQSTASAYMSLYASTKGTALEGEQTRKIFESVAGAMGVLGKSSVETERALMAVSQMASKGTVSMEELRGQLGEALPGALKAAADGMGVSTQKLIEMVESGDVLAKDLLPKLADGLNKIYGTGTQVEGFAASWNRLKNAVTDVFDKIGQSGVMAGLATMMEVAAAGVTKVWSGFEMCGKSLGVFAAAVMRLENPLKALNELQEESARKALRAGESYGLQGKALDDLRIKAGLTQVEIDKLNGKQAASAPVSTQAAAAAQSHAVSTKSLAEAFREAASDAESAAKASSTLVEAQKQAGANSVLVARLYGTEAEVRRVATDAAEKYAVAVAKSLADSEQALTAKKILLEQLQYEAKASGEVSAKKKEEIDRLGEQITALEAGIEKTRQMAEASQMSAQQARIAAETYGDQSARVDDFAKAVDAAREKLFELEKQQGAGIDVDAAARQAKLELGEAVQRYRDAVSDATKAAALHVQQIGTSASLEQKQLSIVKDRYQAIYEVAKAQGREREAAEAMRQVRLVEIKMQEAQAVASRAQATAMIAAAKARQAELEASGQLTEAAKAEINARIAEAEAKKLDAEHSEILAKKLRDLLNTTNDLKSGSSGAADPLRDSLNGAADASDRLNSSLANRPGSNGNPQTKMIKNDWGVSDSSHSSTVGTYGGLGTDAETDGLRLGFTGEALKRYVAYYTANIAAETAQAYKGSGGGAHTTDYDPGVGAYKRIKKEAEEHARTGGVAYASKMGGSGSGSSSGGVTAPGASSSKSVTISIGSIHNQADLDAVLQQIRTAAGVSA